MEGKEGEHISQRVTDILPLFNASFFDINPQTHEKQLLTLQGNPLTREESTQLVKGILAQYQPGFAGIEHENATSADPIPDPQTIQEWKLLILGFMNQDNWAIASYWIQKAKEKGIDIPTSALASWMKTSYEHSVAVAQKQLQAETANNPKAQELQGKQRDLRLRVTTMQAKIMQMAEETLAA